ncbi:AbrB/MazE/SpoVT family DNA-binding domain-containing protein [Clostridium sp. D33t1_170424_F3]|uniref:AbrB/MazE/SpoVT family DNA-binding domain-containing protein n=1 Tax=Clostridium sp. D33t1_170424_F3 TaxID=2787099 RepID=UPI0018A942E3|nr:AbrB/MazE/SpoVT family DNA-binding domain-containing protein [Clostridium sp. D33t1_170424_F3]
MIETTDIVRKVDELGRILLPVEIRTALGISEKDRFIISVDKENRQIILQKADYVCLKCGSTELLKEITPDFYLCETCIKELK